MSLDKVVDEILSRGRREAEAIVESADAERKRMLSEEREEGETLLEEKERQAEAQAERERQREVARAELEAKRIGLQAQREVLDEVLQRAKERLVDAGSRERLTRALVEAHRDEIADGVVLCRPGDVALLQRLVKGEVRGELGGIGGFVVESHDGSRRLDLTFDTLLDDLWEDVVRDVAALFWKEE